MSTLLAGCDDDAVGVESAEFDESWTYSAASLTGLMPEDPLEHSHFRNVSVTCSVAATGLVVSQSSGRFAGRYMDALLSCEFLNSGSTHLGTPGRTVATEVVGPLSGAVEYEEQLDGMSFTFASETSAILDWTNEGTSDGRRAGGIVRITAVLAGATVVLTGRWTAQRVPT